MYNFLKKLNPKLIFILAAIVLAIAAFFSTGYYHFDEHFQILELANTKLFPLQKFDLPYENQYAMRSCVMPTLVILLVKLFSIFKITNPFFIAFILRLISGFLAFISMLILYKIYMVNFSTKQFQKWFLLFSFFAWYWVFISVRFSAENWAGIFFILAFNVFILFENSKFPIFIAIGFLFGLAFLFRFQTGLLFFGFFSWLIIIRKIKQINLASIIFGLLIAVSIGVLIDSWFYGKWTMSFVNYVHQFFYPEKIDRFTNEPWYYYFKAFINKGIPPFSFIFLLAIFLFFYIQPKSPITWSLVPFILLHIFVPHKELRFLFPIVSFLSVMIISVFFHFKTKNANNKLIIKTLNIFYYSFFIVNSIVLLIVIFKPADNQIALYKKIYSDYKSPTVLYYVDNNPYNRVLDITFYKRTNLEIRQLNSPENLILDRNKTNLIAITNKTNNFEFSNATLIYSSFPQWIYHFNFNKWIDRTLVWKVYELN